MSMLKIKSCLRKEEGNVLFLILIAVALFAALSYAVTSSTRSGGGDTSKETTLISSAQITQYPTVLSTALLRMTIGGTSIDTVRFNRTDDFTNLALATGGVDVGVFHPSGGGATYVAAPANAMAVPGQWFFNTMMEVPNIGQSDINDSGDLIAFLPGVSVAVCTKINDEYGLTGIPQLATDLSSTYEVGMIRGSGTTDYAIAVGNPADIDNVGNDFDGQPFGCFQNNGSTGEYVYYHVIFER